MHVGIDPYLDINKKKLFTESFRRELIFCGSPKKSQKLEHAKFRATGYIKRYKTTFQNPQSTSTLSIRAFFVFDLLFIFFWKVWALTLSFLNKNIFQAEICEILRIWW